MTEKIDKLKQTKHNWLFLFQQGYSLISLPLALFNFASISYYLVVVNFDVFKTVFPSFPIFFVFRVLVGPISCILIGLAYIKSPYYRANYEIATSANPYSFRLVPKDIPIHQAVSEICRKNGLDATADKIDALIQSSVSSEEIN